MSDIWMQTHKGIRFDLVDVTPQQVDFDDIAHALARICRFGGHASEFYSVAQHSIIVMQHVRPQEPGLCAIALMHDAAEAYVNDIIRPVKRCLRPNYDELEDRVWGAIAAKFGFPDEIPEEVWEADNRVLVTEARDLLGQSPDDRTGWPKGVEPLPGQIVPWTVAHAEENFRRVATVMGIAPSLPPCVP